jgi:F-type H+-transporting ATPase subunit b
MKRNYQIAIFGCYLIVVIAGFVLCSADALAAEDVKNWRSTFDLVMRWLNFVIIAFVLVKFGRKPIKDFLENRKEEIDYKIKKFEKQKQAAEEKIEETAKMLENSRDRLEKIKKRIVEDGEKKKQHIIAQAQQESRILLEGTQRKIQNQIVEARNLIRSELIDSAITLAEKRLPKEITADDEHKLIERYMEMAAGK